MKVTNLKLKKSVFVPGIGEICTARGSELSDAFHKGIQMELHSHGVLVKYRGTTFIVPLDMTEVIVVSSITSAPAKGETNVKKMA